ncbi:MAG: E3 binding domain-containing protein, partial [Bdellovibrionales bacterium]|nr:E3 binding domain-containing protein [Bdellovibrionales bacterium]
MAKDIKIPSVGESITEVDISEWRVKSGDYVNRDDILLVLDSDKASLELAAEDSGVVEIKVEAGETVPVGSVVGSIDTSAKKPAGAAAATEPEKPATKSSPQPAVGATSAMTAADAEKFSPAARKLAEEKGLSAKDLDGSGRGGRITKEDVLKGPSDRPASNGSKVNLDLPKVKQSQDGPRETRTKMPT